jgi:hypothetical protein
MMTRRVRLHFTPLSEVAPAWDINHDIPVSLIADHNTQLTSEYNERFGKAMHPICERYQSDINVKCGPTCGVCRTAKTTYGKPFCISQLQAPEPYIIIGIVPTCGQTNCINGATELMKMFREDQQKHDAENSCKVCGKYAGSKQCMRCKSVVYCSVEHQKQDWPFHKSVCKHLQRIHEFSQKKKLADGVPESSQTQPSEPSSATTTRLVRLDFIPMPGAPGTDKWTRTQALPSNLFAPLEVQVTPAHKSLIRTALAPLLPTYQSECTTKAAPRCTVCQSPTTVGIQRPVSFLHTEDPHINIYVLSSCGKTQCRREALEANEHIMDQTLQKQREELALGRFCGVCGTEEGTKKCTKCRVVSYCSKEHQKADWKKHKDLCYVNLCMREVTEGQRVW